MIQMNDNKNTDPKEVTLLDVINGIAFSIAIFIAYCAIVIVILNIVEYIAEVKNSSVRAVVFVTAFILYCLLVAFGKVSGASGLNVTNIFKYIAKMKNRFS
jgi:hypothetical protein